MQAVAVGASVAYSLLRLARTIPLPVLMVGAGLFFAGAKTGQSATRKAGEMASDISDEVGRRARDFGNQVGESASAAKAYASDQLDRASAAVPSGTTAQVNRAAHEAGATLASNSQKLQEKAASLGVSVSDVSTALRDEGTRTASSAAATVEDIASDVTSVGQRATGTTTAAGQDAAGRAIGDKATDLTERAGKAIFETIEQNPLLVAGVGLLVGGLIASALPRSDIEDDLIGYSSTAVKRRAQTAASQGFDTAKNVVGEVVDEATRQAQEEGLTPDGIAKAAQDIGQRVRRVAETAVTTAFEPTQDDHQQNQALTKGPTMADQKFTSTDQTGLGRAPHGFEKAATAARTVTDQTFSDGRDLKDKAIGVAGSSSDAIKDQASEFIDAARDVASQATDKLKQTVDGQKNAGAEYVGSLADTIRRAAREFDGDLPIAGTYIRKAAAHVEGVADTIKTGNFNNMLRGAQSFARRQPTAFLGMAVLAGFGVVRFLKSSAETSEGGGSGLSSENTLTRNSAGQLNAHIRGYRDEFTK